jgi:hypothetical protein
MLPGPPQLRCNLRACEPLAEANVNLENQWKSPLDVKGFCKNLDSGGPVLRGLALALAARLLLAPGLALALDLVALVLLAALRWVLDAARALLLLAIALPALALACDQGLLPGHGRPLSIWLLSWS